MDNVDVVEKFRATVGERTGIRAELEPAAETSGDPMLILRHTPPAHRVSRVSDDGSELTWFREISCILFLTAKGSGDKKFRKIMERHTKTVEALFDNEDGGGNVLLDEAQAWFVAWQGSVRPGDRLLRNEELEGSFDWNVAWDVVLYVPEKAFT